MDTLSVKATFPGNKKINVQVGDGLMIETDQSIKAGGDSSAPEPFDLFLSSIAACAGIFALNFCHKRDISTQGIGLEMVCEKDAKKKRISKMQIILQLPENFPEKYQKSIIKSMELCTVKQHILDAPAFEMQVKETQTA